MKTNKDGTIYVIEKCEKCGNPIEMYWCMECESHSESEVCDLCGKAVAKYDPDYHTSCN